MHPARFAGRLFGGLGGRRVHSDDDIHIETDEFGGERRETVSVTLRISVLNIDAISFDPSEVPETLPERIYLRRDRGVGFACQKAYQGDLFRLLLGERAKRPRYRRTAERHHEITSAYHSITCKCAA